MFPSSLMVYLGHLLAEVLWAEQIPQVSASVDLSRGLTYAIRSHLLNNDLFTHLVSSIVVLS